MNAALLLSLAFNVGGLELSSGPTIEALDVVPQRITLEGPYDYVQLVAVGTTEDGAQLDLTRELAIQAPELISVDEHGRIQPLAEGRALLEVEVSGHAVEVPVQVRGLAEPPAPRFITEVQPVLSRSGCNMGTCHGNMAGKNGFKLSLRGYDAAFDHFALTDDLGGRRFDRVRPEESLFLQKPAGQVPHEGGQVLELGDAHYSLLRDWVAAGARFERAAPRVDRIEVYPDSISMADAGAEQQFRVVATLADGTRRDVTGEAFLESNDPEVVTVDERGIASAVRRGEAAVLVRYEGSYSAAQVFVMGDREGWSWEPSPEFGEIDRLVNQKLLAVRSSPSGLCSDAEFQRRVYLDLTGRVPDPMEATAFLLDDRDSRIKRDELVERLLGSPAFVEHWTNRWCDLLQVNSKFLGKRGARTMRDWVRKQVASNRPYDRFVAELLGSEGSTLDQPGGGYWRVQREPDLAMENTTQLFLGIRFNCNKCHDHPFERWTQDQHWQLASYFAQIGREKGKRRDEELIADKTEGEVQNPDTGATVAAAFPYEHGSMPSTEAPRRSQMVSWLVAPENPYFARSYANRLWSYFMGVGLIEPVDDIRAGNPPTNPELLDYLEGELLESGFDARHLMRLICRSHTYQRGVETNRWNEDDHINFAHAYARRLPAEVLYDAIHRAAGVEPRIGGSRPGTRAAQLVDASVKSADGFLDLFGRPPRESVCECERTDNLSLGQALNLVNGQTVADALESDEGALAEIARFVPDDGEALEELWLRFLGRPPTAEERQEFLPALNAMLPENLAALDRPLVDEFARQQAEWEAGIPKVDWLSVQDGEQRLEGGSEVERLEDGSWLVRGEAPDKDHYTFTFWTEAEKLTGLRLEVLPHESLPAGGPGRSDNGNFVLNELELVAVPLQKPDLARQVKLQNATADYSQSGWPVANAIDGRPNTGWAVSPRFDQRHVAVFEAAEDFGAPGGTQLVVTLKQQYGSKHNIGRLRVSVTESPRPVRHHGLPDQVLAALAREPAQRDEQQRALVHRTFLATVPDMARNIRRGALEDLAWALVNSPAFLFNR